MIVRTYGRRSRGMGRTLSETSLNDDLEEDPYSFTEPSSYSLSQEQEEQELGLQEGSPKFGVCNFTFSSQDSTRWTFDSEPYGSNSENNHHHSLQLLAPIDRKSKKAKKNFSDDGRRERERVVIPPPTTTATLMETQEYGELMECVDEVDFALDGLRKKGQQGVRVRRASLLSLLNLCGTTQQRRLLKAQGMAKTIIDAILDLSLDDSPSNLAAATLFYVLTSDGQDSYLLDSSASVKFLLQFLKPSAAADAVDKVPGISQKILAFVKNMHVSQDMARRLDSSSTAISHKVRETLVNCKDLRAGNGDSNDIARPELNPKWISLLTMEKACLSTISLEDTTGTVRKTGGNFKEKLRELGGLDAVFELAISFHSTLEGLIERTAPSGTDSKDGDLECLPLLLKCLKIMENATFLSKENQSHLLRLKGNPASQGSSLSFVKVMINFMNILSELSLLRTPSATSSPEMPTDHSNGADRFPEFLMRAEEKVDNNGLSSSRSSQECSSTGRWSSDTGLSSSQGSQRFPSFLPGLLPSSSGASTRLGVSSSASGTCCLTSKSSNGYASKATLGGKRPYDNDDVMVIDLEESQDPFAFDEDDLGPSKWEVLSDRPERPKGQRKQKNRIRCRDADDGCLSQPISSQEYCMSQPISSQEEFGNEEQNEGTHHSSDTSCTTTIDEESSNLVGDCLLTAIKVLMNLTNDNAIGCQQIAACGGLETLSSMIARHFPSFNLSSVGEIKENTLLTNTTPERGSQTDVHLSDQELDFLVTILGLLVNMVENNGDNRSRLAAAQVSFSCSTGLNEVHTGVIPLLCSIFLANRGAGEAAEEELQSWDAEEVVLQGEKEAEKMIVEAYAALLLAFLSTESKNIRNAIANHLPDRSVKVLVPVLERFVTFHLSLNMMSPETHKTVSEVIESCRIP